MENTIRIMSPRPPSQANTQAGRLRALVVDDHPINARVMTVLLQQMGMHIGVVTHGADAVSAVAGGQIDIVFMDYHMPVLDGFDATRQIRALPAPLDQTPIILVTADVATSTQDAAQALGIDAFVGKPVRMQDIKEAVAHALAARSARLSWIDDQQEAGTMTASSADAHLSTPSGMRPLMINNDIFQELRELIPTDQWQLMLDSLFAPETGDVDVLKDCLHQGNRAAIGDQAHKLKGAALLMGLSALGEAAAELEHLARRSDGAIETTPWCTRLSTLAIGSHDAAVALLKA